MRLKNWEVRLVAYLTKVYHKPFEPGVHDCALFFAGCVEAETGVDHAVDWRGTYKTLAGGEKALQALGFENHVDFIASKLEEIVPALARKGDGAVVQGDLGIGALGVVQGDGVYALTRRGMAITNRMNIVRAFRI